MKNLLLTLPLLLAPLARFGVAGRFWGFAAIRVAGFGIMKANLPGTKARTLEEIERELVK